MGTQNLSKLQYVEFIPRKQTPQYHQRIHFLKTSQALISKFKRETQLKWNLLFEFTGIFYGKFSVLYKILYYIANIDIF